MRTIGVLEEICEGQWVRFIKDRDVETTLTDETIFTFRKVGGPLQALTLPTGTKVKLLHRSAKPMDGTSWTEAMFTLQDDGASRDDHLVTIVFDKHRKERRIRMSEAMPDSMIETAESVLDAAPVPAVPLHPFIGVLGL